MKQPTISAIGAGKPEERERERVARCCVQLIGPTISGLVQQQQQIFISSLKNSLECLSMQKGKVRCFLMLCGAGVLLADMRRSFECTRTCTITLLFVASRMTQPTGSHNIHPYVKLCNCLSRLPATPPFPQLPLSSNQSSLQTHSPNPPSWSTQPPIGWMKVDGVCPSLVNQTPTNMAPCMMDDMCDHETLSPLYSCSITNHSG